MFLYKQVLLPPLETAVLNFQDDRRTDKHMVRCDLVPFLCAEKASIPTLGHRFLVKFPWVGKAIEVKCPTFARGPPLGLNIDRCITCTGINKFILKYTVISSFWGVKKQSRVGGVLQCICLVGWEELN